jgi:hypothetical protein
VIANDVNEACYNTTITNAETSKVAANIYAYNLDPAELLQQLASPTSDSDVAPGVDLLRSPPISAIPAGDVTDVVLSGSDGNLALLPKICDLFELKDIKYHVYI